MKFTNLPTLAFIVLLPTLLALGAWQLQRADEKRALLNLAKKNQTETVLLLPSMKIDITKIRYRHMIAEGHYDAGHQLLIDNQVKDGKVGYYVLTPFILTGSSQAVLVNRGWVPAGQRRTQLPEVTIGKNLKTVAGRVNDFPGVGLKLAGADQPTSGWPSVVQVVDSEIIAKLLGYSIFPFMIELDENIPEGYRRDWQRPVSMPPEQHQAYAFQWFGLAFLLSMLFIWFSRLHKND
jgi:surfeit locus 1 family protein